MTIVSELKCLYEIDNEQWLDIMIKLLKERRLEELYLEHLIEKLEELGHRFNRSAIT